MSDPATAKIWFDASTVKKLRGHSPVGLTRVESNVLRGALEFPESIARFCTFNRYGKKIEELNRSVVQKLLDQYGIAGEAGHGVQDVPRRFARTVGKAIERNLRVVSRQAIASSKNALGLDRSFPNWKPGDVFVISGATWDSIDPKFLEHFVVDHGLKMVAIIADMIPVLFPHQFQDANTVDQFTRFAECVARHSSLALSISQSTQRDFDQFAESLGVQPQASQVIYLGEEPATKVDARPANLPVELGQGNFVVSVSTIQVRKNHQLLYQLWRRFAEEGRTDIPRLVLVGSPGWMTNDLRQQIAKDPLVQDTILVLNHVSDEQLAWLYENCRFSLYPSLYEGWGLPIVESLHRFKPCIASDTSSMPEASQGLALHLDPLDFRQWYDAILRWSSNPMELAAQSARIRANFRHRSWEEFGSEFCSRVAEIAQQPSLVRAA